MFFKGHVSSLEGSKVRIKLDDRDNVVTVPLNIAAHVGELHVGDKVTAIFFNSLGEGQVIARW